MGRGGVLLWRMGLCLWRRRVELDRKGEGMVGGACIRSWRERLERTTIKQ